MASTEGLADGYQVIIDKPGELERLKVRIEHKLGVKDIAALKNQVDEAFYRELGVESEVELVPQGVLDSGYVFKTPRIMKTY